jgi:uncharacterized UBP type Zn finger protein
MAHVPPLAQHLFLHEYVGLCAITFEYQKVLKQLFTRDVTDPVDPTDLLSAFREIFPEFEEKKQHDATEVILKFVAVFERSLELKNIFNGTEILRVSEPSTLDQLAGDVKIPVEPRVIMFTFSMYDYKFPIELPFEFEDRRLFAIVMHQGDADAGHYALLVRVHNGWYIKEDERILEIPYKIEVMRGTFYMALYRRSGTSSSCFQPETFPQMRRAF